MNRKQRSEHLVFNNRRLNIVEKNTSGLSSTISKTASGYIVKKFKTGRVQRDGCFERECYWLDRLQGSGVVPELVDIDYGNRSLLIEYAGAPILSNGLPFDWRTQVQNVLDTLAELNCKHNDISETELLVHDGVIKLVDFGYASLGNDMTCSGVIPDVVKNRLFDDKYIINLIDLLSGSRFRKSEPHCFVLWCSEDREIVEKHITDRFEIIQAITYNPKAFAAIGSNRLDVLDRFYQGRTVSHGNKGYEPFVVYFVFDETPVYGTRRNLYSGCDSIVNVNTYELKKILRKNRSSYFHASDSIQESYDNLESLTFNVHRVPIRYWEAWRPKFSTLEVFFEQLNRTDGLEYVVLRNFENFPGQATLAEHPDIDILVNDYYLFKRVTGGIGYKHKLPNSSHSSGPAYEYGGYKVANKVMIGGQDLTVDVRFVGDDYYDAKWQLSILRNRVRRGCFFVPDSTNLFYSLLYHALVHKRRLSEDYRDRLTRMACDLRDVEVEKVQYNEREFWALLDTYMGKAGYRYVRPRELNIPFNARERAGLRIDTDLTEAREMLSSGRFREACHLLRQVLADEPRNGTALELLAKTERQLRKAASAGTYVRRLKVFLRRYRVFRYLRQKLR